MLEGKQKLSVGELIRAILSCILFLLYLVFCLVYHQFWIFYVCFYLVGDVRANGLKKEQIEGKWVNFELKKRSWCNMVLVCRGMRCIQPKIKEKHVATWLIYAATSQGRWKIDFWGHATVYDACSKNMQGLCHYKKEVGANC